MDAASGLSERYLGWNESNSSLTIGFCISEISSIELEGQSFAQMGVHYSRLAVRHLDQVTSRPVPVH